MSKVDRQRFVKAQKEKMGGGGGGGGKGGGGKGAKRGKKIKT